MYILMMYRLRRYDVFRFAQNDVAPVGRNDAMFAIMCRQAHIIRRSRHHWARPTSFAEGKHHSKGAVKKVSKKAEGSFERVSLLLFEVNK